MSCDLFIFVGEKSADLHGEKLLKSLKEINPSLKVLGVGGPRMRAQGLECILPMEKFQVMGFIDVFLALPKLIRQFYFVANAILEAQPKAVVFIDYPGFNLRMAKHLRKKGYKGKLCHFICPSVWAWGKKRIPAMAETLDLLLTILPFEKQYFSQTSLPVEYVGHPLIARMKDYPYQNIDLPKDKKIIALFPGSRKKELKRNLPLQLKVCQRLKVLHPDLHFAISISEERFRFSITEMLAEANLQASLIPGPFTYDLMKASYAAIAKSGTVTLELALHGVPTVVTYGISALDVIIARDILRIRLPFYCLVNIIAGQRVFPELIGPQLTEKSLFNAIEELIHSPEAYSKCQGQCHQIKNILGDREASQEAAKLIYTLIS